jgi:hypothetical protein
MRRKGTWAAVLVALPIALVAIGSVAYFFSQIASPCVVWRGSGSLPASASHSCRQITGQDETTLRPAAEAVAVQGVSSSLRRWESGAPSARGKPR